MDMRIMVLDRNPLEGEAYAHIFSNILYKTHPYVEYAGQAFTISQGRETVNQSNLDVIFWGMDTLDDVNLAFLRFIKKTHPYILIVIISITGTFEYIQNAIHNGAYDCYQKPMLIEDLKNLLDKLASSLETATYSKKRHENGYNHFLDSNSASDAQTILAPEEFWALAATEDDMKKLVQICIEFATSTLLSFIKDSELFIALSLPYNQFVRQLCICDNKGSVKKCFDAFVKEIQKSKEPVDQRACHRQIDMAKAYIYRYTEQEKPITLQMIAKDIFMSPSYLSRVFKKIEGINFVDYMHTCRINHAKILLRTTNETIINIAQRCTYSEPNSFRRLFHRLVGVTPAEYRKKHS
jgi:YesN/AraC family two-component response regulator